ADLVGFSAWHWRTSVGEDPGVLAAPALGGIDHERPLLQRHPRQPTGLHVDVSTRQREWPQIDVPRLQSIPDDGGDSRQTQRGLRDVAARILLDALPELGALAAGRVRPDQHAMTPGSVGRLDHELLQVFANVPSLVVLGTD